MVCKENAQKRRIPVERIVKHELVHHVFDLRGSNFDPIPEPLLTDIVREMIPSEEVLLILLHEREYTSGEEFTARVLSELPDPLFAVWVLKSLYL